MGNIFRRKKKKPRDAEKAVIPPSGGRQEEEKIPTVSAEVTRIVINGTLVDETVALSGGVSEEEENFEEMVLRRLADLKMGDSASTVKLAQRLIEMDRKEVRGMPYSVLRVFVSLVQEKNQRHKTHTHTHKHRFGRWTRS